MNKTERKAIECLKNTMALPKTRGQLVVGRHLALAIHNSLCIGWRERISKPQKATEAMSTLNAAITRCDKWVAKRERAIDKKVVDGALAETGSPSDANGVCELLNI